MWEDTWHLSPWVQPLEYKRTGLTTCPYAHMLVVWCGCRWKVSYRNKKKRLALLVSKLDHCLYDLLIRHKSGARVGGVQRRCCGVVALCAASQPASQPAGALLHERAFKSCFQVWFHATKVWSQANRVR